MDRRKQRYRLPPKVSAVLVGLVAGALVAVPALVIAFVSAGAGHGHYVAARALFPGPMLLTLVEGDTIGALSIAVGLLQFPIYGFFLGWGFAGRNYLGALTLFSLHMVAAAACFAGNLPNFS